MSEKGISQKTYVSKRGIKIYIMEFPDDKSDILLRIVDIVEPMIPGWIEYIAIEPNIQDLEHKNLLMTTIDDVYLHVSIYIAPRFWLENDFDAMVTHLTHEIIHIPIRRIERQVLHFLESIYESSNPFRNFMTHHLDDLVEMAAMDFELAFGRMFYRQKNEPRD